MNDRGNGKNLNEEDNESWKMVYRNNGVSTKFDE